MVWDADNKFIPAVMGMMVLWLSFLGCTHTAQQPPSESADISALQKDIQDQNQALDASKADVKRLEQENADLKLQVLEQEALVKELRNRSTEQQKSLDTAIVDVVRSKAKLRSLESKAEAASTVAEAEIALNALKSRAAASDWMSLDEIAIAENLLEMSSQEFDTQNFGGALYLANQTKSRVRAAQHRLSNMANLTPVEGESTFAQPVPLKVLKNSNLRAGPGLEHNILTELASGTPVVGFSFKGKWIHVEATPGKTGWIFQTLVGAR